FFYNAALLMEGTWFEILRAGATAVVGVFLLSSAVQGWFMGGMAVWFLRIALTVAALSMIEGGWTTDLIGIGIAVAVVLVQRVIKPKPGAMPKVTGMD
ncbi:MAG TPA: TRAP transporter permease, partial [Orrella sp.]